MDQSKQSRSLEVYVKRLLYGEQLLRGRSKMTAYLKANRELVEEALNTKLVFSASSGEIHGASAGFTVIDEFAAQLVDRGQDTLAVS